MTYVEANDEDDNVKKAKSSRYDIKPIKMRGQT